MSHLFDLQRLHGSSGHLFALHNSSRLFAFKMQPWPALLSRKN
jgi:hypothetical protein